MFASKKTTPLLALSLFLSLSIAQSSHAYALPKNTTLGVAITAAAIGAAGAVWYACQPQDPEQDLYEFAEYLCLHYESEIVYFNTYYAALYVSLQKTDKLAADIKKLKGLIAAAKDYVPQETTDFYRGFVPLLMVMHEKMIADPRYLHDLHNQRVWERWCNRQYNWPAPAQETAVSNQSEQQEKPVNKTETAKPDNIVETRSGSFPNWELTHPAADL